MFSKNADHSANLFFKALIAVAALMVLTLSVRAGMSYLDWRALAKSGEPTQAKIIERIRFVPTINSAASVPKYRIGYQYLNPYGRAEKDCALGGEFRTTPLDKACYTTIQSHAITEDEFRRLRIGDAVDVRFMPQVNRTQSTVLGLTYSDKNNKWPALILAGLGLLGLRLA